jgi:hypothetical protein
VVLTANEDAPSKLVRRTVNRLTFHFTIFQTMVRVSDANETHPKPTNTNIPSNRKYRCTEPLIQIFEANPQSQSLIAIATAIDPTPTTP